MKFSIKFNDMYFTVEAKNVVQAVIKIIDIGFNVSDNMEFQVEGLLNSNSYQNNC